MAQRRWRMDDRRCCGGINSQTPVKTVCHWLGWCFVRQICHSFSTGRASGTQVNAAVQRTLRRSEITRPAHLRRGLHAEAGHHSATGSASTLTHETCVINWFSDANDMAALTANRGDRLAGNVASEASPTRNTLKSCDRFSYPAVVLQKHISVA